jgi:hypothetical protein
MAPGGVGKSTSSSSSPQVETGPFSALFALDPRALGLFRASFGLGLWIDLAQRFRLRRLLFSNEGVLTNFALSQKAPPGTSLSIYTAFSSPGEVTVAFVLTALVYTLYTLGLFTRTMQVLALLCVTSLVARNPLTTTAADAVLCALAAFSLFLPLDRRFSVDAVRRSLSSRREIAMHALGHGMILEAAAPAPVVSVAGLGLALQLGAWFVGAAATDFFPLASGGPSVHWALFHDAFATPLGGQLRTHAPLVAAVGWLLTLSSLLALLAFFAPTRSEKVRLVGFGGVLVTALGLGALFCLGPLPFALVAAGLLTLPAGALDRLGTRLGRGVEEATVVAPAADAGWLWFCRVLARLDGYEKLRFVDWSDPAKPPEGYTETDFAVYENGVWRRGPEAIAVALRALPGGGGWTILARVPPISWLLGVFLDETRRGRLGASWGLAHGHRGAFEELGFTDDERPVREGEDVFVDDGPTPLEAFIGGKLLGAREVAAGVLTLLVVLAAAHATPSVAQLAPRLQAPIRLSWVLSYLQIRENVGFLHGFRDHEDGALVVDLRLADGTSVDPLTGTAPDRSVLLRGRFGENALWTAYTRAIRNPAYSVYRDDLRRVLRTFARRGSREARVKGGEIVWVRRPSPPPESPEKLPQEIKEEVLFENR